MTDISREKMDELLSVWEMGGLANDELHQVADLCRALRAALDRAEADKAAAVEAMRGACVQRLEIFAKFEGNPSVQMAVGYLAKELCLITPPAPMTVQAAAKVPEIAALMKSGNGLREYVRLNTEPNQSIIIKAWDAALSAITPPIPMTVHQAAKILLDAWRNSETTDADDLAQDQLDSHRDASACIEAWLVALAADNDVAEPS